MRVSEVTEDFLLAFLEPSRDYEGYPEPFRGYPDCMHIIDIDSYKRFIAKYLDVSDYLLTPTSLLLKYVAENDVTNLMRSFYRDMSIGVMKELYYSGVESTHIVHRIKGVTLFTDSMIIDNVSLLDGLPKAGSRLRGIMRERNMRIDNRKEIFDTPEFQYAKLLFAMAEATDGVPLVAWSRVE